MSIVRRYTLMLLPDPETGGYTVRVPARPECTTQGETREAAEKDGEEISDDATAEVLTLEMDVA